jgi:cystathionine gamma-synthase
LGSTYVNELFGADALVLEYNSREFLPRAATMNRNASHLVSVMQPYVGTPSTTLTHVYYPSTCWSRKNYQERMRYLTPEFTPGYGGLFTLEFESVTAATIFFDSLNVHKGPSLGAFVTLAQPYVQTVFSREKEWAASYGLRETIVRISVGLENKQLLVREFKRALRLADRFKAGRESHGYLESFL